MFKVWKFQESKNWLYGKWKMNYFPYKVKPWYKTIFCDHDYVKIGRSQMGDLFQVVFLCSKCGKTKVKSFSFFQGK